MTAGGHLLALDQGTTSCRAILFDPGGGIVRVEQEEFGQHFPRSGWVEHDADEIWRVQEQVTRAAAGSADLAGIGIANQRETVVVWERRSGRPIHRALVWQDRRTAGACERLRADGAEPLVRRRTGLVLDPYFSATKIAWVLDSVDGARERAEAGELAYGTIDSWLVWNLTGGERHVTDASNASRTLLYDIHLGRWDHELCDLFGVPAAGLPEVCDSSGVVGETAAGVPIAGIAGDQQAALFGQACFDPGQAKNTYGTGCFLLLNTGDKPVDSKSRLLTTVAWRIGGRCEYALEGSVFIGGAVVQWLRDGLGLIENASDIEPLAASVDDNDDVYLVPAFAGLGAPHWDPHARGALVGLTRGTTAGHVARAALESIAFQVADVLDAMQVDSGIELADLRVDGGAAANDLLLQIQADIQRVPVVRPAVIESTARGAAFLAGLATGAWSSREEIRALWQPERTFRPRLDAGKARALRQRWQAAVERARGWAESDDA